MPVQSVNGLSLNQYIDKKYRDSNTALNSGSAFRVYDNQEKAPTKVKIGVAATTLTGILTVMALVFKRKGIKFNSPAKFFKALRTIEYDKNKHEIEKLVTALAIGSVGGGLLGGAIFDKKENMKAKYREAVIQLIGNIGTPLLCVAGGIKLFEKHLEPRILDSMKNFLKTDKTKGIPKIIASACFLVAGIFAGNKIGNFINKKVFKCDEKRTLKLSDMSPHLDDLGVATTFVVPQDSVAGHIIARFVPLALMIAGFSTGVAQEHHGKHPKKFNKINETNDTKEVKKKEQDKNTKAA